MAMSVGGAGGDEKPMSEINTTPLVDVMLVLLIIFLIAVPVAIQTIQKLKIPVIVSQESKDKVENLLLTVSTTDAAGRSAGDPGFEGANLGGDCRIYFNNITPVDSNELRDQAFKRLDFGYASAIALVLLALLLAYSMLIVVLRQTLLNKG